MEEVWLSEVEAASIIGLKNVRTLKTWRWAKKHLDLVFANSKGGRKVYYERESVLAFAARYKIRMDKRVQNKIKASLRKRRVARKEVQDSCL